MASMAEKLATPAGQLKHEIAFFRIAGTVNPSTGDIIALEENEEDGDDQDAEFERY